MKSKNVQILNAGVASQSPIIYYKKIKHFIEVKKLNFDELIVFWICQILLMSIIII